MTKIKDYRIIEFQIHTGFFLVSLGNLLIDVSFYFEEVRPLKDYFLPSKVGSAMASFGGCIIETGFLSIFFERGFATICMKRYEKMDVTVLSIILVTFSLTYGIFTMSMWHICKYT